MGLGFSAIFTLNFFTKNLFLGKKMRLLLCINFIIFQFFVFKIYTQSEVSRLDSHLRISHFADSEASRRTRLKLETRHVGAAMALNIFLRL